MKKHNILLAYVIVMLAILIAYYLFVFADFGDNGITDIEITLLTIITVVYVSLLVVHTIRYMKMKSAYEDKIHELIQFLHYAETSSPRHWTIGSRMNVTILMKNYEIVFHDIEHILDEGIVEQGSIREVGDLVKDPKDFDTLKEATVNYIKTLIKNLK